MMDERRQDDDFGQSLRHLYDNIEIPDSSTSWTKVQAELMRRKRRKRLAIRMGTVAAAFLVLAAIAFNTNLTGAYSFSYLFKHIQNAMVEVFHERAKEPHGEAALTLPPGIESPSPEHRPPTVEVTLEEALEKVPFLQVPATVPDRFQLKRVRVYQTSEDQYNHVIIEYTGADGEAIRITQRMIHGPSEGLKAEISTQGGEYKDVVIHDRPGIILIPDTGNIHLEWLTDDRIFNQIIGSLSEEEILAIARSMEEQ